MEAATTVKLEAAICHCCGLIEECTTEYLVAVRSRHNGRWICGLCTEAVNEEMVKAEGIVTVEEAIGRHVRFCKKLDEFEMVDFAKDYIGVVRRILRKSLSSPPSVNSLFGCQVCE